MSALISLCHFSFNHTATTEIYTLSLHDALPISCNCSFNRNYPYAFGPRFALAYQIGSDAKTVLRLGSGVIYGTARSEEHTSELQSHSDLVCRLLLEKKKKKKRTKTIEVTRHYSD